MDPSDQPRPPPFLSDPLIPCARSMHVRTIACALAGELAERLGGFGGAGLVGGDVAGRCQDLARTHTRAAGQLMSDPGGWLVIVWAAVHGCALIWEVTWQAAPSISAALGY